MHLTHLKITDFMGIKAADMAMSKPINLFIGPNEAGKSSIRDGVLWLLTGNARNLKNEEARGDLIRAGAKAAEVAMIFEEDGSGSIECARRKTPKSPSTLTGSMPMPVDGLPLPLLLDHRAFFEMDSSARRALLFKLIPGMNPTAEDLMERATGWLKTTDIKPTKEFQLKLQKLVRQAVRDGFKAAENEAIIKRRESKRAMEVNAGYVQVPIIEITINETVHVLSKVDLPDLEITLKTLKAKRDDLLKAMGRLEISEEKLHEVEAALAAAQRALTVPVDPEAVEQAKKALTLATGAYGDAAGVYDLAAAAHNEAMTALAALEKPGPIEQAFPEYCSVITVSQCACPNAGMVVGSKEPEKPDMTGAELAVNQAFLSLKSASVAKTTTQEGMDKAAQVVKDYDASRANRNKQLEEIDRLEDQMKQLRAQASNAHAAKNLTRIEAEIVETMKLHNAVKAFRAGMEKVTEVMALVERYQAEADFYNALQKALAPAGIPSQMISEALAPINELLAVPAGYFFQGRTLTLNQELDFTLEGSPLLSKSAELRVGVAIQYVLAKLAGARLLMVDEVDMLDPGNRKGFIEFLRAVQADFDTIMAFSTAGKATPAPFPDVQVWAVNDGTVTAL